ncbi:Pectate lyase [Streptomyces sp. KS_5]|nr:Pectate lyase [Streptomyces sp. KS_5]
MRTIPPRARPQRTALVTAAAVTVSTSNAFRTAVTGGSARVVRVNGLISLSGQIDVGSNTTVLGVGSSSGSTGGGLRLKNLKGSLVGHSDNTSGEDTGHLTVTFHHNLFSNA